MTQQFVALNVALELVQALARLLQSIQRYDKDLAGQLRRAGTSVPSCLSEGAQRSGRDRSHLFRVAGGSAAEVHTQLLIAVAWGYVSRSEALEALGLSDRLVGLTWGLTHTRR